MIQLSSRPCAVTNEPGFGEERRERLAALEVISPFVEMLGRAQAASRAVGAFTVYGLEAAVGVLAAAERRGVDVIILVSAETFRSRVGPALVRGILGLCDDSAVSCCLQLDHVSQLEPVAAGFAAGFGAVMVDGSLLEFVNNVELVSGGRHRRTFWWQYRS